ncbi:hypothetical protein J6U76_06550 [bacterium]|nr:hypothetical protein [bacterium]
MTQLTREGPIPPAFFINIRSSENRGGAAFFNIAPKVKSLEINGLFLRDQVVLEFENPF